MKIKDLPFHLKHHSEQQATAKTDQISQTHLETHRFCSVAATSRPLAIWVWQKRSSAAVAERTYGAFILQQLVRIDRERPRLTPENDVVVDAIAGTLAEGSLGSKSMGEISVTGFGRI